MKALTPINTLLVCYRTKFKLEYWRRRFPSWEFKLEKRYPIAVGDIGFSTPAGVYLINTKAKNPDWMVPDSDWARNSGLVPGTIVSGTDPGNPIRSRWLGVTNPEDGVGIHGTLIRESIGTRASHGCIRMFVEDVEELYSLVPKFTPIHIT